MLTHIFIKNFTLIDQLTLSLQENFSAITGETGAGKSLIFEALALALGERLEQAPHRDKNAPVEITLEFTLPSAHPAYQWLVQEQLAEEMQCIIRRTIMPDGRSRLTLNSRPITQSLLRQLAPLLVHLHTQQSHHTLLQQSEQLGWLDRLAGTIAKRQAIEELFMQISAIEQQHTQLLASHQNRTQEQEWLQFQIEELEHLAPHAEEWELLHQEYARHQQTHHVLSCLNAVLAAANEGEQPVYTQLYAILHKLNTLRFSDDTLSRIITLFETARIHVAEAVDELSTYRHCFTLSPERIRYLEDRLSHWQDLARKHHVPAEELHMVLHSLQERYQALSHLDEELLRIEQEKQILLHAYDQQAHHLSTLRTQAIPHLNADITQFLQQLGMPEATLAFVLQTGTRHRTGIDQVSLQLKANPGLPAGPLAQVISGGELSRVSLTFHILAGITQAFPPLFCFDEADVGISGETAHRVGECLRQLGEKGQVLAITHLAQVAARAHHHIKAYKETP